MSWNWGPCQLCGLIIASVILGCSQSTPAPTQEAKDKVEGKDSKEGWIYNSGEGGFSLRLPSANWKKSPKSAMIVDFYAYRGPSPMLAGVFSLKKQTLDEFQEAATELKDKMSNKT